MTRIALVTLLALPATLAHAQNPQQRAAAISAVCRAEHTKKDGKVDVQAYVACVSRRDKEDAAAERAELARRKRDTIEHDLQSPDARVRARAECQQASTGPDGRLELTTFGACLTAKDRAIKRVEDAAAAKQLQDAGAAMAAEQARRDEEKAERAKVIEAAAAERRAHEDELRVQYEAAAAETRRLEEQQRARCGKDYNRIGVSLSWSRVRDCSGPFGVAAQTLLPNGSTLTVYENYWALVSVSGDRIVRWIKK